MLLVRPTRFASAATLRRLPRTRLAARFLISSGLWLSGCGATQAGRLNDAASYAAPPHHTRDGTGDRQLGREAFVYVGTGSWSGSEPGRIAVYRLEDDGALTFVERIEAGAIAAYMAADVARRELYVADEGTGALRRYDVDPATGRLTLDAELDVPGAPVYVALDSKGRTLLTASYDEGVARAYALDDQGFVTPPADTETTGMQAHCVVLSDDGFAYVCNKGANTIAQLAFDAASHTLTPLPAASAPHPGGPRHAALAADGRFLYVVSENEDSVRVHARSARGELGLASSIARLPSAHTGAGAHVLLSPHGHLYVSNRGPSNTLAVYAVNAASGALSLVEHEATMGIGPRHFAIDPRGRFLIAGNLDSQQVAVFSIDAATGALAHLRDVGVEGSPFFVGIFPFGD